MRQVVSLLFACSSLVVAQSYQISTVAGGGVLDGVLATRAALLGPDGLAVDSGGNLYIADNGNERIRKVAAATGVISTVAGNGVAGFGGDGGPATSASISGPGAIAVDSAGNLYIADNGNERIRKVAAATGIITTVAGNGTSGFTGDGGAAASASLNGPVGIAVDSSGNLYIADYNNNVIRKVTAGGGTISTIAGNGAKGFSGDGGAATGASLFSPLGVVVDSSGNLFIADFGNARIRKVAANTGIITTVAGSGVTGFSGDGGAAINASLSSPRSVALDSSGNLFIADYGNFRIREVAAATGNITTTAGGGAMGESDNIPATSAGIQAISVAVDMSGNLYIADAAFLVRRVTAATGIIATVAGGGTGLYFGDGEAATSAGLGLPWGVAVDSSGNLYIADEGNSSIRKVTAATGLITTIAGNGGYGYSGDGGAATSASLSGPRGVAVDSSGNLYIADSGNSRVRVVAAATGIIATVAGNGIKASSGDGGAATSASLNFPNGVALDASGNLYIADGTVRKVAVSTGIITTVAGGGSQGLGDGGPATSASLGALGVAVSSSGNLYIADYHNARIREVAASTNIITTVALNIGLPFGVALDSHGNLYFPDYNEARVWRLTTSTGVLSSVAGNGTSGYSGDGGPATSASLNTPESVAVDSTGNVYISELFNQRVRKLTPVWAVTVATNPAGLNLTIDGVVTGTPQTASWVQGSSHTLFAPGQTTASGLNYSFASWSQGGAASQSVTVSGTATYTASFQLLPPTISCPLSPLSAQTGVVYTINCTAAGGVAPYAWSITAGALPPGLALNAATGVITGTPGTAGLYSFTVQAVDSNTPAQTATLNVGFSVLASAAGCLVTTGTSTATPTTDGGVGYVAVSAAGSCSWTAVSNVAWITLYAGANTGTGNWSLPYFVTPNVSSLARSGTLSINGVTFTINQPGLNASVNERFVRLLYRNFLGRLPDPGGLAYWKGLLDSNQYTKEQIGYFFFTAPEFDSVERFTAGQYVGILGRDADYAGWNFHRTNIRDGLYGADYQGYITNLFLGSAEYAAKYGNPSNTQFITLLYQNALARTPAPSEAAGWLTTLAGTTRVQVAEDFLNSQEFLNGQNNVLNVELLFFAFLSRDPDSPGFTFWLSYTQAAPLSTVVGDFVDSAEFQGLIGP